MNDKWKLPDPNAVALSDEHMDAARRLAISDVQSKNVGDFGVGPPEENTITDSPSLNRFFLPYLNASPSALRSSIIKNPVMKDLKK